MAGIIGFGGIQARIQIGAHELSLPVARQFRKIDGSRSYFTVKVAVLLVADPQAFATLTAYRAASPALTPGIL